MVKARPKRIPRRRKELPIVTERRNDLIQAAIGSIAEIGYDAVTVTSICDAAGFSRGLIGHYFKGKDALLLEAVKCMTQGLAAATRIAVDNAGPEPLDRLHAVVTASFSRPSFTPEKVAVWVSLASRARWSPALTQIYRELWRGYRVGVARLIDRAARRRGLEVDADQAALTISQLIEGLWVGYAADPVAVSREKAEAACHAYLDRLLDARDSEARPEPPNEKAASRG